MFLMYVLHWKTAILTLPEEMFGHEASSARFLDVSLYPLAGALQLLEEAKAFKGLQLGGCVVGSAPSMTCPLSDLMASFT